MSDSTGPTFLQLLNLLWIGAATLFWRLWQRVDDKADKGDMEQRHVDNIGRLDKVIGTVERIDSKVDTLSESVAVLKDRAGINGRHPS